MTESIFSPEAKRDLVDAFEYFGEQKPIRRRDPDPQGQGNRTEGRRTAQDGTAP